MDIDSLTYEWENYGVKAFMKAAIPVLQSLLVLDENPDNFYYSNRDLMDLVNSVSARDLELEPFRTIASIAEMYSNCQSRNAIGNPDYDSWLILECYINDFFARITEFNSQKVADETCVKASKEEASNGSTCDGSRCGNGSCGNGGGSCSGGNVEEATGEEA